MAGDLWYEQSMRWTPPAPIPEDAIVAWWAAVDALEVPTRLLINPTVHRALQHRSRAWPSAVRRVDTLLTPSDVPDGLTGWVAPPPVWGWLWRAPLRPEVALPNPSMWPESPTFKAEWVAHPNDPWPHAGAWWLHWVAQDPLRSVPMEVWLDERDGLDTKTLQTWDRWVAQVGRLAGRSGWPVKPWAPDADELDDPRWDPTNHQVWSSAGWQPDPPFWSGLRSATTLVPAPCERCAASHRCPGPHQPSRWATPEGLCSQGRSWRLSSTRAV